MSSFFRQHFLLLGFFLSACLHFSLFFSFFPSTNSVQFRPLNIRLVQTSEEQKSVDQTKSVKQDAQAQALKGSQKSVDKNKERASEERVAGRENAELALYQERILALLDQAKRYPALAKQRGEEGVVLMEIGLSPEGKLLSSSLKKSSGVYLLDEEAKALAKRVGAFPPLPKMMKSDVYLFTFPIQFSLE